MPAVGPRAPTRAEASAARSTTWWRSPSGPPRPTIGRYPATGKATYCWAVPAVPRTGVIVERSSRFVQLIALPEDRKATTVRDAIARKIGRLPDDLARSLTWDRGKEMADHVQFTVDTDVDVYFCDPHSPWQRGTAENTNGLLRQYLPRKDDFSELDQDHLDEIADELNGRPRETLEWMTRSEQFTEFVATTG